VCSFLINEYKLINLVGMDWSPSWCCSSYEGPYPTHSIIVLKLLFFAVLESGVPPSSRPKGIFTGAIEILEKMNEYQFTLTHKVD